MLIEKCNQLYHLVEEGKEHPSPELEEKIKELNEEIELIFTHSYDSDGL
jgi:hypothetical protein